MVLAHLRISEYMNYKGELNMKTNNQHLKTIANNTGSNVTGNKTDNYYLKRIANNTEGGISGGSSSSGFSGDYNDLTNKPTIPSDVSDLTDNNNTTFAPKPHPHSLSDIACTTIPVIVTYEDDSTGLYELVVSAPPTPK